MLLTAVFAVAFVLLSVAQGKVDRPEVQDKCMERLRTYFSRLLPPAEVEEKRNEVKDWDDVEKNVAAEKVAKMFLKELNVSTEYAFHSLIGSYKCAVSNAEPHAVMHLKFVRPGICESTLSSSAGIMNGSWGLPFEFIYEHDADEKWRKLCDCTPEENVYCTWTGTVDKHGPNVTHGYLCFKSDEVTREDETEMATESPCESQRYGIDGAYRLKIPAYMKKWSKKFLLYEPPIAIVRGESGPSSGADLLNAPKHPLGRTGIAGRGLLRHYGENQKEFFIIVRDASDGLEVLLNGPYDDTKGAGPLPTFSKVLVQVRQGTNNGSYVQTREQLFHSLIESSHKIECTEEKIKSTLKKARKLFRGYLPHPHTTDNAWVYGIIYFITTRDEPCFNYLVLKKHPQYRWKKFNDTEVEDIKDLVDRLFTTQPASNIVATAARFEISIFSFFTVVLSAAVIAIAIGCATSMIVFGISLFVWVLAAIAIVYWELNHLTVFDSPYRYLL